MKRVDETVGGISGDDVDLVIDQGAIEEAEVHNVWRGGEVEAVAVAPTVETIGALEEFVADTGVPLRSDCGEIRHGAEMEIVGVVAADDQGEGVFEAERFGELEIETLSVLLFDALVDGSRAVCSGRFVQDGGEGRASVFNVEIEVAGEEGFLD